MSRRGDTDEERLKYLAWWNKWKPRYGKQEPDSDRCAACIRSEAHHRPQCTRKPVVEEHGLRWCKQHAPSACLAKEKAREAKFEAHWAKSQAHSAARAAHDKVARVAIKMFDQKATFDDLEAAVIDYRKKEQVHDDLKGDG